jgi:hypothetical protein
MHDHGTAVLTESAGPASAVMSGASARDQWVARCTDDAARALATRNASLLPVIASAVFLPEPERCPDCHGTGYVCDDDFNPCYCMAGQPPVHDFTRHTTGTVIATIEDSRRNPGREADVWVPCQHCGIAPIRLGPYDGDDLTRVPWVPDCPVCNDTGWMFSHYLTCRLHVGLPTTVTTATLTTSTSAPAVLSAPLSRSGI